jgi:hypothetical protein
MATGFNKDWEGLPGIETLMDMSQAYLDSSGTSKQQNEFLNKSLYKNIIGVLLNQNET